MQTYLDFEKGLAEIEGKAEELRTLARRNAEMTVDEVEATPEDPDARRRAVHAEGRSTVEEMKGTGADT